MKKLIFGLSIFIFCGMLTAQNASYEQQIKPIMVDYERGLYNKVIESTNLLMLEFPEYQESYILCGLSFAELGDVETAKSYQSMAAGTTITHDNYSIEKLEKRILAISNREQWIKKAEQQKRNGYADQSIATLNDCFYADKKGNEECGIRLLEAHLDKKAYMKALEVIDDLKYSNNSVLVKSLESLESKIENLSEVKNTRKFMKAISNAESSYNKSYYRDAKRYYEEALSIFSYPENYEKIKEQIKNCEDHIAYYDAVSANTLTAYENYLDNGNYYLHNDEAENVLQRDYIYYARKFKSERDWENAIYYYKKYINRFPYGGKTSISTANAELCDVYYLKGKGYLANKYFSDALTQFQMARNCNHPLATKRLVRKTKFKANNAAHGDFHYMGWHSEAEYFPMGMYFGGSNSRRPGFYYNYRIPGFMTLSGTYFETNNENQAVGNTADYTYTGTNAYKYFVISAGMTKRILYPLDFHIGLGIMNAVEYKEFRDNTERDLVWAKNPDNNITQPTLDFGFHLTLKPIIFSYGWTFPISPVGTKNIYPHFGVAITMD